MDTTIRSQIMYLITQGFFFLFLLILFATVLLGFVPIKHPLFAQRAQSFIMAGGADSCSVSAVEMTAWKSITLQGLYIKVSTDRSNYCEVRTAKTEIPVNILQYLLNKKRILQALRPDSTAISNLIFSDPSVLAQRTLSLCSVFKNGINASASDVWLTIKQHGKTMFLGTGGHIELSPYDNNPNELVVETKFPIVNTLGDGMQNVRCTAILTSDGQLSIGDFSAIYFDGRLRAKGSIALFDKSMKTSYSVTLDKMDFSYWYAMHGKTGKITGSADIGFRGEDIPFNSLDSTFTLSIMMHDCTINDLPLQQSLATSLFIPSLSSLDFRKVSMRLKQIDRDTITTEITGTGNQISFESNGWILESGMVQQMVSGSISVDMINTFPPDVQKVLSATPGEDWKFSCRLFGTLDDPRFELSQETLQRAVGGIFNNLQQEIFDKLMK